MGPWDDDSDRSTADLEKELSELRHESHKDSEAGYFGSDSQATENRKADVYKELDRRKGGGRKGGGRKGK
jgi:hypothetical protein